MDQNQNSTKMFTPDTQLSKSEKKSENILVFARVRPLNDHERSKNATLVLDCPGSREITVRERNMGGITKTFTFDKVFGPHSKQIDVYKAVVAPLLEEVLLGYNCTVFAYGQTGTGKTFTMEGERSPFKTLTWESDPIAGIVPRAMSQLFDELRVATSEFTVRVSLVEMYNEEVYDLLSPTEDSKPKTVRLYEDSARKGSVLIQGLEEVIVRNKHEVYAIMERGSQMRKTASTLLNANSSRSHTVFTVTVHIKESSVLGEDLLKIGKLHLVDLAGSENIGRSGAVDKRAREAGNINQSLLTLGRVITALVERAPHVPYRESKLTRLLQDSLGGRTKTSIIATVSPASINLEETLSTLDYAHRAKNIQNRPEVNQKLTKKAMLKEYTEEIERLRRDLIAAREKNGIFVDKENYERMMSQIESQGQDLTEKIQYTRNLEEQCQQKETEMGEIKVVLQETTDDLTAANAVITDLRTNNSNLTAKLEEVEVKKDEMEHLVIAHSQTEKKLATEASKLLSTATESTFSLDLLHSRLERKKSVEQANLEAGKRFCSDFNGQLSTLAEDLKLFRQAHSTFSGSQRMQLEDFLLDKENKFKEIDIGLQTFGSNVQSLQAEIAKITAQENAMLSDSKAELTSNVSGMKAACTESLTLFMNDKLLPQARALRSNVEELRDDVNAIDKIITEYIVSNGQVAEDFIKGRLEYLEKQMVDMEGIKELYRCHLESIYQDFLRQKTERLEQAEKIAMFAKISSDNAQLAMNMAKEMEGICAQEESNMLKGYYNRQCEFNSAADKIYGNIDDASRLVKVFPQDLQQLSTAVSSTVRCKVGLLNEALNKQGKLLSKTKIDVEEAVDAEKENWQKYEVNFTTILNDRMGAVEECRGQVSNLCTEVGTANKEQVSEVKQKLGICIENDRNHVKQRRLEIFNHNDAVSTSTEAISNNLFMQCGKLNEFWDSTYLVDTATGATPQRKAYDFPRNLSATSPHERILDRIRRFRL